MLHVTMLRIRSRWGARLGCVLAWVVGFGCGGEAVSDGSGGHGQSGGSSSGGAGTTSGGSSSSSGGSASGGSSTGGSATGGSSSGGDGAGGSGAGGGDLGGSGGDVFAECAPAKVLGDDLPGTAEFYDAVDGPWYIIRGIQGDGSDVYVLDDAGLFVIEGDSLEAVLVSDEVADLGFDSGSGRLKTSETHVYYATERGVARVPKAGGEVEVLYEDPDPEIRTEYIEVVGDTVYFSVTNEPGVWTLPATGGEPTQIDETMDVRRFARQGEALFVADIETDLVYTLSAGGDWTAASPYNAVGLLSSVAASADHVFWVADDILKASPLGSPDQVEALGVAPSSNIEYSDGRVYWLDENLGWIAEDGSACGLLFEDSGFSEAREFGVTLDYVFVNIVSQPYMIRISVAE